MNFKEIIVDPVDIDSRDKTYRITTETRCEDLVASIESLGLIHLPFIRKKGLRFIIVGGFRRIAALKKLGIAPVKARLLAGHVACARVAIADNSLQRQLNLVEMSRALHLLADISHDAEHLAEQAAALALIENPRLMEKIKPLCRLPGFIQKGIVSGSISLTMALELGALSSAAAKALVGLFAGLKLGLNRQREMLTLLREISLRDEIPLQAVIGEDRLQGLFRAEELDLPQKTREILELLRQRRFPSITAAGDRFERLKKDLKLGSGIKLIAPKNFEGTEYNLNMSFNSLSELKDRRDGVQQLLKNPTFRKIIN